MEVTSDDGMMSSDIVEVASIKLILVSDGIETIGSGIAELV